MARGGNIGIVGYGSYIPRYRIKLEEIAKVWGADADAYKRGLMLYEKSVPAPDQDVITMSVEAARRAVVRAGINAARNRRDLYRLGIAPVRGEAVGHDRGGSAGRNPGDPLRGYGVRLQGRQRRHVCVLRPCEGRAD